MKRSIFVSAEEQDRIELFTGMGSTTPLVNLQQLSEEDLVKGHYNKVMANPLFTESRSFHVNLKEVLNSESFELCRLLRDRDSDVGHVTFEVFHKSKYRGLALVTDYWANRIYYFSFGCSHPNDTRKKLGNCYNQYDCPDCGRSKKIDSGG